MTLSPINTSSVNSEPINGSGSFTPVVHSSNLFGVFNSMQFNALNVDEAYTVDADISSEIVASIYQNIAIMLGTAIVSIEQDIQFRLIFSGIIVSIEQQINALIENKTIKVEQNIIDKVGNSFFNRNGWTAVLTIDGYVVPNDRIFRDITITKEENQSNQCSFALLVSSPVEFIDEIWGKSITVDYVTAAGSTRMFTGVIAIPEIDLINKYIHFTCSNNRDEIINNTMSSVVKTVGRYSEQVQGKFDTPAAEMNLRMQTMPYSLDFDGSNIGNFNSWFSKDIPDYTLTASDIFYREPKIIWQDRTKIKNSVTINASYQYTRLYHYQRPFSWDFPFEFCEFLEWQYSMPNLEMIETAVSNAKWVPTAPILFTSVFPPGHCAFGAQLVLWNTSSIANFGTYSTIFDSLGNVVSDPDGHNVYGFKPFTKQTDISKIYTIGAHWTGSTRFSQYIEEDYTLNVFSSQSIDQFGEITDANNVTIKDDFDSSGWENYTVFTPQPAGATTFSNGSYYFNEDTNPNALSQAILTEIDIAKASILSTHRNTQVIIDTPIKPYLELSHTIAIDSETVSAKGKAQRIVHTLAIAEGKGSATNLTVALFRSQGTATTTPTYVPARPSDSIDIPSDTVVLGSHYGVTDPSYNGHIGNKNNPRVAGTLARTNVQEEFRVDTPAISDSFRELRKLPVEADFDVFIPDDPLDVSL